MINIEYFRRNKTHIKIFLYKHLPLTEDGKQRLAKSKKIYKHAYRRKPLKGSTFILDATTANRADLAKHIFTNYGPGLYDGVTFKMKNSKGYAHFSKVLFLVMINSTENNTFSYHYDLSKHKIQKYKLWQDNPDPEPIQNSLRAAAVK